MIVVKMELANNVEINPYIDCHDCNDTGIIKFYVDESDEIGKVPCWCDKGKETP